MMLTVYMARCLRKKVCQINSPITLRRSRSYLGLFEARAILLGKLGRHDQALELYAYRLQDYLKAEQCVSHLNGLIFILTCV